jgi:dissimilatory sulfite reductase (desulfoviridin) alpha/beta subunit
MPSILADEESVLAFIEKVLDFYRANGLPGERFCKTLDRLGFERALELIG